MQELKLRQEYLQEHLQQRPNFQVKLRQELQLRQELLQLRSIFQVTLGQVKLSQELLQQHSNYQVKLR